MGPTKDYIRFIVLYDEDMETLYRRNSNEVKESQSPEKQTNLPFKESDTRSICGDLDPEHTIIGAWSQTGLKRGVIP